MKSLLFLVILNLAWVSVFAQIPAQMAFNETANRLPVTEGLSLWFDAADVGSVIRDANNRVSLWQDKSGNNNHAVQNTLANRPTYATNSLNGLAAMNFTSNAMTMIGSKSGTYQTVIAVRNYTANGYQTLFASSANSDFSLRLNGGQTTGGNASYAGDNNLNDWSNGNTGATYVNGVNTNTISPNTFHMVYIATTDALRKVNATFSLSTSFSSRGMTGRICELLVFNRQLTANERQQIERYLARKWKIAITPALNLP